MGNRILAIDQQVRGFIKRVTDHAEANRIEEAGMRAVMAGIQKSVGFDNNFICYIPRGFRVVYSLEEQPCGWCRHLSISVDSVDELPSVEAVEMIMDEFGFKGGISEQLKVWVEEIKDTAPKAINVLSLEDKK